MDRSSRAPPPPPLNLACLPPIKSRLDRSSTADSYNSTPNSKRSIFSSSSSGSFSSLRKTSTNLNRNLVKTSPTVNVHTTCGRHTDQLLFGGPSLKDLARSIKRNFEKPPR
ncbi:hypothetical protein E4U22_004645 [Claviceps purpurea]|uniref:Uncharacterized protein n=1 Tax=Claviceps aff. purpurea TaxID=1967640 RepID=A0A9P7QEW8_9HYPO|nr:hypothetical protein E4U12_000549 [Claviceps purpurea]KAG6292914.1 hypothetical protein E4U09_003229 [Claviceps aff. purpurea]KAG6127394.1 hypothetical protein E4U28_000129 [Claviceps purpurea]KAG6135398.1 hypothetical protein E4U38_001886 [Claviceps purpurea]KAG6147344.1 hypothetical protein E4U37_008062 [Claviceps purpurea]